MLFISISFVNRKKQFVCVILGCPFSNRFEETLSLKTSNERVEINAEAVFCS